MRSILSFLAIAMISVTGLQNLCAQDKMYSTDALKGLKKIASDEWKSMQDKSAARQQQFKDAATGENTAWTEKGYTVLKMNQTLNLTTEVNALFEYMATGGQNAAGVTTTRKRSTFKLGPGNFEIKEGVIKRVQ